MFVQDGAPARRQRDNGRSEVSVAMRIADCLADYCFAGGEERYGRITDGRGGVVLYPPDTLADGARVEPRRAGAGSDPPQGGAPPALPAVRDSSRPES